MAWLAKLDARAASWSPPARWVYLTLKWYLAVMGGIALFYAWTQNALAPDWLKSVGDRLADVMTAVGDLWRAIGLKP